MKTNQTLRKLRAGEPAIGCFLGLGSPNVAELMARAGMDWLVIETEHNGLDSAEIERMLMAIDGTDATPIVRVPNRDQVYIQRALDMGAMGILVPGVRSADEARAVVSYTRYPPAGVRSWGPLRASAYTLDNDDYLERANDNILVSLILETKDAVENLDAICAVPGVDVLTIGPWDLSLELGLDPRKLPLPEIERISRESLAAGRARGVETGVSSSDPDSLRRRLAEGYRFIQYGPDYTLMAKAVTDGIAALGR